MANTVGIAIITSIIINIIACHIQRKRIVALFKSQYKHSEEEAVKALLKRRHWRRRSLVEIKMRLGNHFTDNELRNILVRAGAVRFGGQNGTYTEMWGLLNRNKSLD